MEEHALVCCMCSRTWGDGGKRDGREQNDGSIKALVKETTYSTVPTCTSSPCHYSYLFWKISAVQFFGIFCNAHKSKQVFCINHLTMFFRYEFYYHAQPRQYTHSRPDMIPEKLNRCESFLSWSWISLSDMFVMVACCVMLSGKIFFKLFNKNASTGTFE